MASQRTLFGALNYAEPISQYVGNVNVSGALAQLDEPLSDVDAFEAQGIQSYNVDKGAGEFFEQSQQADVDRAAGSGDIYGAAREVKRSSKRAAKDVQNPHHAAGAAQLAYNTGEAFLDNETKRKDKVDQRTSHYQYEKGLNRYAKSGGIGEFDEKGRSTSVQGFGRIGEHMVPAATTVSTAKLRDKLEKNFKSDKVEIAKAGASPDGYLRESKESDEFVRAGKVSKYVENGLLEDSGWTQYNYQQLEQQYFDTLVKGGYTKTEAWDEIESDAGQVQLKEKLKEKAKNLATRSGDKVSFNKHSEDKSIKSDATGLKKREDYVSEIIVGVEGSVVGEVDTSSSKGLTESIVNTNNLAEVEMDMVLNAASENKHLELNELLDQFNVFYTPEEFSNAMSEAQEATDFGWGSPNYAALTKSVRDGLIKKKRSDPNTSFANAVLDNEELVTYLSSAKNIGGKGALRKLEVLSAQENDLKARQDEADFIAREKTGYDPKEQQEVKKYATALGLDPKMYSFMSGNSPIAIRTQKEMLEAKHEELFGYSLVKSPFINEGWVEAIRKEDPEWAFAFEELGIESDFNDRAKEYEKAKDTYLSDTSKGHLRTNLASTLMPGFDGGVYSADKAQERTANIRKFFSNSENFSDFTGRYKKDGVWSKEGENIGKRMQEIKENLADNVDFTVSDIKLGTLPGYNQSRNFNITVNGEPMEIPSDQMTSMFGWLDSRSERLNTFLSAREANGIKSKVVKLKGDKGDIRIDFPLSDDWGDVKGLKFYNNGDFKTTRVLPNGDKETFTGEKAFNLLLMLEGDIIYR
jgi:hypothetical protein